MSPEATIAITTRALVDPPEKMAHPDARGRSECFVLADLLLRHLFFPHILPRLGLSPAASRQCVSKPYHLTTKPLNLLISLALALSIAYPWLKMARLFFDRPECSPNDGTLTVVKKGPVTDYGATVVHWMRHRQPRNRGSFKGEAERPSASYIVDVSPCCPTTCRCSTPQQL